MNNICKRVVSLCVAMMMGTVPVFAAAQEESGAQDTSVELSSLFPLEEVRATIDLSEYLPVQLNNIPIAEVLSKMVRRNTGEPIAIDPAATTVWSNYYDENGKYVQDAWAMAGMEDTIDLKPLYGDGKSYLELIVGSGNQLDTGNIRYIVYIILPDPGLIYQFDLYEQVEQSNMDTVLNPVAHRQFFSPSIIYNPDGTYRYIPEVYLSVSPRYQKPTLYYLNMTVNQAQYPGIDIEVYEGLYASAQEAIAAAEQDSTLNITAQITGQTITEIDAGYQMDWSSHKDLTVVWRKDGTVLGADSFVLSVSPRASGISSVSLYHQQADNRNDAEDRSWYRRSSKYQRLENGEYVLTFTMPLKTRYPTDAEYYLGVGFYDGETEQHDNSKVDKAVVGHYTSLEAAAAQPDIKDQLFVDDMSALNQGYKANYSGEGVDFTVFAGEEHFLLTVIVEDGGGSPVVGREDQHFRVDGVSAEDLNKGLFDAYGVWPMDDTYYSNGYQTLLINDTDADLTALRPRVNLSDNSKIYHNGVLESTEGSYQPLLSAQDFSAVPQDPTKQPKNSVKYEIFTENNLTPKDYWVTMVKKEQGAKLFVNGPDEREVFLNNYYNNAHDIFIANIGTEELTGLTVTLDATNVKLDEYWTVGGQGNDTLAPFDTTSNGYSKLFNIAKIRLVPDGEGEISGILTIAADGQEPRVITLKGVSGNPKIDTTAVRDAVQSDPYQFTITTNNMHDWNKVTFSLSDGKLPSGIQLSPSGELYGVPEEAGSFTFEVMAQYSQYEFDHSLATFTLNVLPNADAPNTIHFTNVSAPEPNTRLMLAGYSQDGKMLWIKQVTVPAAAGTVYTPDLSDISTTLLQSTVFSKLFVLQPDLSCKTTYQWTKPVAAA